MHTNLNQMPPIDYPKVIFAANSFMAGEVTSYLQVNHIGFVSAVGFYDGVTENSWIINLNDLYKVEHFLEDEKSVLELRRPDVTRNYSALLVWRNGDASMALGELVEVSEQEAKASIGYTARYMRRISQNEKWTYFVCK